MAMHLSTSVAELPGIGAGGERDLRSLGILTVGDLLEYLPYRYDDYSQVRTVSELRADETVTVEGTIKTITMRPARNNRRLTITEAILEDETGAAKVVWFNQPYLVKTLKAGTRVSLAGRVDAKYGLSIVNPVWEPAGQGVHTGRFVPVYGLTATLTMRRLRAALHAALVAASELEEWIPNEVREREKFVPRAEAIRQIHFPESADTLARAVRQIKFEELFLHQMMFAHMRREREVKKGFAVRVDDAYRRELLARLPYQLTGAQERALGEVLDDLQKATPMNRLLEGDVGSGKTVVAALAIAQVLRGGLRAAYLAPTEILARQQHATLSHLLDQPVGLLTSAQKEHSDAPCLVGTHALFHTASVLNLALVVIDEQHRFGVEQRHALLDTGGKPAPHLLSMSATPIPRSLALSVYGDLVLSVIDELPAGRRPIETKLVVDDQKKDMWLKILAELKAGHQAYVVCPLIDPSDKLGSRSVTEAAAALKRTVLKNYRVEVLHGRLKPQEKEAAMERFKKGEAHVLVATSVIEVGVDVPNATVMLIVGAERFGLAQLHQLRGRVGRSDLLSYCFLRPDTSIPPLTKGGQGGVSMKRLQALEQSTNGFELAEKDLQLRGPGNVFGNAQSGFPDFKLATPADVDIMKSAQDSAARVLEADPDLVAHIALRDRVSGTFDQVHLE